MIKAELVTLIYMTGIYNLDYLMSLDLEALEKLYEERSNG